MLEALIVASHQHTHRHHRHLLCGHGLVHYLLHAIHCLIAEVVQSYIEAQDKRMAHRTIVHHRRAMIGTIHKRT